MEHLQRQADVNSSVNSAAMLDGLLRVAQIVRVRFNDWLDQYELNDGRYSVLSAVANAEQGGCSQAELAERLGQSESNISTMIERMQRDGLVNRLRSDADRRKRVLLITPAGRSTLASVDASRSTWAADLLSGISADERPRLFALLQRLASSLEAPTFTLSPGPDRISQPVNVTVAERVVIPIQSVTTVDPTDDPQSPQFALRKMLLALSASMGDDSHEKEAA